VPSADQRHLRDKIEGYTGQIQSIADRPFSMLIGSVIELSKFRCRCVKTASNYRLK